MRKFLIFLAIGIAPLVMKADPLNPFSFSLTVTNSANYTDDEARVRGVAKAFAVKSTATNAFNIKLSAPTGTLATAAGDYTFFSGTFTNATAGMLFGLTNNILYNDTVRMSVSNPASGGWTNSFNGILIMQM